MNKIINITTIIIMYIAIFLISFFPAYLWYKPEHARVGYIFTIGFALTSYIPFLKDYGRAWRVGLIVLIVFGYSIESIGILTCFPYGCFSYSEQLGIKLFDIVPFMLAFNRPPLVFWVWNYTKNIFWHGRKMRLLWGFGLVVIDFVLDPIAVMMWLWSYPWWWFWFGVPLSNFVGWMFSGTISMIILDYCIENNYNKNIYSTGLRMTMTFFVWYALWRTILSY